MTTKDQGCCGQPSQCAFTTATGRCRAREEREELETERYDPKPKRLRGRAALRAFFTSNVDADQLRQAKEEARESERARRQRDREQGHDGGRTMAM